MQGLHAPLTVLHGKAKAAQMAGACLHLQWIRDQIPPVFQLFGSVIRVSGQNRIAEVQQEDLVICCHQNVVIA